MTRKHLIDTFAQSGIQLNQESEKEFKFSHSGRDFKLLWSPIECKLYFGFMVIFNYLEIIENNLILGWEYRSSRKTVNQPYLFLKLES